MKILFRVDGNSQVGLGHLYRSITIANTFCRSYGVKKSEAIFLSKNNKILGRVCEQNNFSVYDKRSDISEENSVLSAIEKTKGDIIIIDKLYSYTAGFVKELKKNIKVFMLHNLCEGGFYSDIFVLPAAHIEDDILNDSRWNNGVVNFYEGREYVVVNERIKNLDLGKRKRSKNSKFTIVISTGGADPEGVLFHILEWLSGFREDGLEVVVLIGESFAHRGRLAQIKRSLPDNFRLVPYDPAEWLNADLAVCTFGITTYDLMYLGVPSLCIGHIPSSAKRSAILQERFQATVNLGYFSDVTKDKFLSCLGHYMDNQRDRLLLGERSRSIIDGGGAERIAKLIHQLIS